jgi:lipoate-protein ligase B
MQSYLVDLGKMNYEDAHHYQLECMRWRLLEKQRPDIFIAVEHPPVFTLGRSVNPFRKRCPTD